MHFETKGNVRKKKTYSTCILYQKHRDTLPGTVSRCILLWVILPLPSFLHKKKCQSTPKLHYILPLSHPPSEEREKDSHNSAQIWCFCLAPLQLSNWALATEHREVDSDASSTSIHYTYTKAGSGKSRSLEDKGWNWLLWIAITACVTIHLQWRTLIGWIGSGGGGVGEVGEQVEKQLAVCSSENSFRISYISA